MNQTRIVVNAPMKSVAVSVLLTIFFGGLGLLYSSVKGGIIMVIVELINIILCFFLIGFFLLPIIHLISVAWGVSAVNAYNRDLLNEFKETKPTISKKSEDRSYVQNNYKEKSYRKPENPKDYQVNEIANRLLHHINNTTVIFRDMKTSASAFLETLSKAVYEDKELASFINEYSRIEIRSHLNNIILLCNKRSYNEAYSEVLDYLRREIKMKQDQKNSKVFNFSFNESNVSNSSKKHGYCTNCGTSLESSDIFCPECGNKK